MTDPVQAWHLAYLEHRKRLRLEDARYKAECAALREELGPPPAQAHGQGMSWPEQAWHQAALDELPGAEDDQSSAGLNRTVTRGRSRSSFPEGTQPQVSRPPCERTG